MILGKILADTFAMTGCTGGVIGSSHKVSRKYLPQCAAEFRCRYNNSHDPDIFGEAIRGC